MSDLIVFYFPASTFISSRHILTSKYSRLYKDSAQAAKTWLKPFDPNMRSSCLKISRTLQVTRHSRM